MRILIVEDDFSSRQLLKRFLSPYGDCDIAVNGDEAVEAFRLSLDEADPYGLVCLDVNMPNKNGFRALEEIRREEWLRGIPPDKQAKVVMTTAEEGTEAMREAIEKGATWYLVKPIRRENLISKLGELGVIQRTET